MAAKSTVRDDLIQAGAEYLNRKNISRAHGSSLRKLRRGHRIALGLRPLVMKTRFTFVEFARAARPGVDPVSLAIRAGRDPAKGETFARLHPLKGWRFGEAI